MIEIRPEGNFIHQVFESTSSSGVRAIIKDTSEHTVTVPSNGGEVSFEMNVDSANVFDTYDRGDSFLTLALRELSYCDTDGVEKKILVLATEPYTPEQ